MLNCHCCAGQTIYVLCYGVTSAAYVLLTTLVLADLLGADKFTNSFGLLLLFQGVATFGGPPIVGYMFDSSGSYNSGFVLMGAVIALSGVMLYPIPCIKVKFARQSFGSRFNKFFSGDVGEAQGRGGGGGGGGEGGAGGGGGEVTGAFVT